MEQHRLTSVYFKNLKALHDLEFELGDKNVTAIFGKNGSGKSTILHAMACIYRAPSGTDSRTIRFPRFFKKEDHVSWTGSFFRVNYVHDGTPGQRDYYMSREHWSPDIKKRPVRYFKYIGIDTCTPDVERTETRSKTKFYMRTLEEEIEQRERIIAQASEILGKPYDGYQKTEFLKHRYKRVTTKDGKIYSSLTMGAGEQRVFTILEALNQMPAFSLLLVDELDLTLHTEALNRLVDLMVDMAEKRHLQIVFSTHREELAYRKDINIRHIWPSVDATKTQVLEQTTPDCLRRLTGKMIKPLEIFVEDLLAEAIARQVVRDEDMLPYVDIQRFGSAQNAFTIAASWIMAGEDTSNRILLTDGDEYATEEQRIVRMNKVFTGTENGTDERRLEAVRLIKQYHLPKGEHPEHFLWSHLKEHVDTLYGRMANEMGCITGDKHKYLYQIRIDAGEQEEAFLYQIMNTLHNDEFWGYYVAELRKWLQARKELVTGHR